MPRSKPAEHFFPTYEFDLSTIVEKVDTLLAAQRQALEDILNTTKTFTWDNLMQPLEAHDYELSCILGQLSHIQNVKSSEEIHTAKTEIDEKVTAFGVERTQNKRLFDAMSSIDKKMLNPEQQKILTDAIRDAKLVGIDKPESVQRRIKTIKTELSNLQNQFEKNNTDSEAEWLYVVEDEKRLAGLPKDTVNEAKKIAQEKGKEGWVFTLSLSTIVSVLNSADDRALRKAIFYGSINTSSELNADDVKKNRDNGPVICRELELRQELAHLLGFDDYRGLSLAKKMATVPQVDAFLTQLSNAVDAKAKEEAQALENFATTLGIHDFAPWDNRYVQQKLTKAKFDFDENELKPYFPLSKVLSGLWSIVEINYGIKIEEVKGCQTIDDAVRVFDFYNKASGDYVGRIYADFYARPGQKRGGAWMDTTYPRFAESASAPKPPVIVANCNFTAPSEGEECLLTPTQAVTLLHEFGHALHGVLTTANYPSTSGPDGVPWDTVEMPSQFNENFLEQPDTLAMLSGTQSGEAIPREKLDKFFEQRHFLEATQMKRQLVFAMFDWTLHEVQDKLQPEMVHALFNNIAHAVSCAPHADDTRMANSFGHLFGGGYAAGYWLYNWSLMMACDAWEVFSKDGPLNPKEGKRFLDELLGPGGARPFESLWMNYVGHQPKIDALLRYLNVAETKPLTQDKPSTLTTQFSQSATTPVSLSELVTESEQNSAEETNQPQSPSQKHR